MTIKPGKNIALKIPRSAYAASVRFYREALKLNLREEHGEATVSASCAFGRIRLWLDCVDRLGRADVWLELLSDDPESDAQRLIQHGAVLRDEVEPLPQGLGHWIADPAGNTLLLARAAAPALPQAIPQLPSGDLAQTELFYVQKLGFAVAASYPEQSFLILSRDECELHFWHAGDATQARTAGAISSCYMRVEDAEALFHDFKKRGAPFRYELTDQPWGMREFQIDDPFGSALRFGSPMS